jgi:signal transduction histidine kinase
LTPPALLPVQRVDVHKPVENPERPLAARASEDDHAALSTYLLRQMEGERSQLAKQLHDELGGLITAAKMDMQWLSAHIGKTLDAQGAEKFRSVVQMLDQAMTLKRRVVESLRPSLLDHFGLAVALRSHFDEHCRAAGIDCVASLPEETFTLDPSSQLTLFRVAQEVLAGVLARGGAKNVELVVEGHEDEQGVGYVMTIGDDGAAMDVDLARAMPSSRHRVALAGGRIDAVARAAAGAEAGGNRVRVFVPRSAAGSA